jgi:DNA-binding SARP family transcriptional activator
MGGTGVRFGLLGTLLVHDGAVELAIAAERQRTLFAALLLNAGTTVSIDTLADLVWEQDPPPSSRVTLQGYVMRLRKILGPALEGRLATRAPGYALAVLDGESDLADFQRLTRAARDAAGQGRVREAADGFGAALALWRGEPLADVPALHRDYRHGLAEARLQAVEGRIDARLRLGEHLDLVPELTALAAAHPLRERPAEHLMTALRRAGRRAEALEVYQRTRRALVDELGIDPGPALRALHAEILADEPDRTAPPPAGPGSPAAAVPGADPVPVLMSVPVPAAPVPAPPPPVPAQLPGDLPDFVGREPLLTRMAILLGNPALAVPVAVVTGAGGAGKSTLALHAAHQARDRFPDGQLYVHLAGAAAQPADPAEVLGRLLRALGTPAEALPQAESERSALWRSTLAYRRVLILADDARDAAQVMPLIPGVGGSVLLVTARDRLADLYGATFLPVDLFDREEARELFTAVVGPQRTAAQPAQLDRVLDTCADLPLAVRIAASRLASRPRWSVRDLADRLADAAHTLDELAGGAVAVRACFAVSQRQLPAETDRAFRLLALAPGAEIGLAAAAALLDLPARAAEDRLETLVDVHLLETPRAGRYRLHDLLRAYAAELAAELADEVRDAALDRLLAWQLQTADAAVAVLLPNRPRVPGIERPADAVVFPDPVTALRWLESDQAALTAAVDLAGRTGRHAVAWRLAAVLEGYFVLRNLWTAWRTTHAVALAAVQALGDTTAEAAVLGGLSQANRLLEHTGHVAALNLTATATHTWTPQGEQESPRERARQLSALAYQALAGDRPEEAARQARRAAVAWRDLSEPDPLAEAQNLALYGRAETALGDPALGVTALRRAVELLLALDGQDGDFGPGIGGDDGDVTASLLAALSALADALDLDGRPAQAREVREVRDHHDSES